MLVARNRCVCPNCLNQILRQVRDVVMEEVIYRIKFCSACRQEIAVPFLLVFDDNRPEDEMEVDL